MEPKESSEENESLCRVSEFFGIFGGESYDVWLTEDLGSELTGHLHSNRSTGSYDKVYTTNMNIFQVFSYKSIQKRERAVWCGANGMPTPLLRPLATT